MRNKLPPLPPTRPHPHGYLNLKASFYDKSECGWVKRAILCAFICRCLGDIKREKEGHFSKDAKVLVVSAIREHLLVSFSSY